MIHRFLKNSLCSRKKNDREKIEKTCQTMRQKDRGDLKLHSRAINNSANSQIQQEFRLWKSRFSAYSREGRGGGGFFSLVNYACGVCGLSMKLVNDHQWHEIIFREFERPSHPHQPLLPSSHPTHHIPLPPLPTPTHPTHLHHPLPPPPTPNPLHDTETWQGTSCEHSLQVLAIQPLWYAF